MAKGFAAMDPKRRTYVSRQGGRAAHKLGVAHEWTSAEAREAGRKGGLNGAGRKRRTTPKTQAEIDLSETAISVNEIKEANREEEGQ